MRGASSHDCRERAGKTRARSWKPETWKVLSPAAPSLRLCKPLQERAGAVQVPGGRRFRAPELAAGLAHGAGVVGQALDVLKGQVDNLVTAGAAVEVPAGEPPQARLEGDAALAVGRVRAQPQGAGQGAALQAARQDGALPCGGPGEKRADTTVGVGGRETSCCICWKVAQPTGPLLTRMRTRTIIQASQRREHK